MNFIIISFNRKNCNTIKTDSVLDEMIEANKYF